MYVLFSKAKWERQFLLDDLLKPYYNKKKIIYEDELGFNLDFLKRKQINVDDIKNNNIFVFSSNKNKFEDIYYLVKEIKPKIIIHLSDEWGTNENFQSLARHTGLLLRQYHHHKYISTYKNILYIPLGYSSNFFENNYKNIELKCSFDRKYIWSFIGNIKQDRIEMLKIMKQLVPNISGRMDTSQIRNIYRESIFVPIGRGNVSLDCFRLYEASSCGAIPIIVGGEEEYKNTFKYEENPPWLRFNNWKDAVNECQELLKDPLLCYKKSIENVIWWKNRINNLQNMISFIC
jgi:hypothetical protein